MNRYHMAILFSAIALVLFTLISVRANALFTKREADNQLKDTLHFAMSSAINTLSHEYGGANDCNAMSSNFFKALSEMNSEEAIKLGRVLPEDFYPHVPVMIYLEERYYHVGYFDGKNFSWDQELSYTEDHKLLSQVSQEHVLLLIETQVSDKINAYRDSLNLPSVDYVLPDYMMRNMKEGTIVAALESFPTTIHGHYYSGMYSETASIKWREE